MTGSSAIVLLCRHGRTALNAAGLLRGLLDVPLDAVGVEEAASLARQLKGTTVAMVVSSPLTRAVQTGHAISAATGSSLSLDVRLIDRDYGPWAGTSASEVAARFGTLDDAPDVEPSEHLLSRATHVLDDHANRAQSSPVVLVSHDAVIRALLSALDLSLGHPDAIPQQTACWNLLRRVNDAWVVEQVDQTGPLHRVM